MKLAAARLCLDCEEVHADRDRCPSCGSEAPTLVISRVIRPMPREAVLPVQSTEEVIRAATAEA